MKTYWKLSENGWEYIGYISVVSYEEPIIKIMNDGTYVMSVDGVDIYFDEEIVLDPPIEKGGVQE